MSKAKAKYSLTYFNGRGRGETLRLLFSIAGVQYEDKRVEFAQWQELKPQTPWGHMPVLAVDGKGTIGQSMAIARYIAREHGLAGKSSWETAVVDSIVDSITEIRDKAFEMAFEKDEAKKKQLQASFKEKVTPGLQNLEKILASNNSGAGFFVGKEITLADVHFFATLEMMKGPAPTILDDHGKLKALYGRLEANPKIADHIKKRPQTPF